MSCPSYTSRTGAASSGLSAKATSSVFKNARAASGDDATTTFELPSRSRITGPYLSAMRASATCGAFPSSGSAPTTGNPNGPGGSRRPPPPAPRPLPYPPNEPEQSHA